MNQTQLLAILQQIQAAPLKNLGQNFLVCPHTLEQIITTANLSPEDQVLEIGPGLGILTEQLLQKAQKVVAVEKDPKFYSYLKQKFIHQIPDQLTLINQDILQANLPQLIKAHFLAAAASQPATYQVVANIPYNITSQLLYLFLETRPRPQNITLLVQKEVGQKICPRPGRHNPLSLLVALLSQPRLVAPVAKTCFYPVPRVDSALIRLENLKQNLDLGQGPARSLLRLIKIGFSAPRKKLINNLNNSFPPTIIEKTFSAANLNPHIRAQELTLEQWQQLAPLLSN